MTSSGADDVPASTRVIRQVADREAVEPMRLDPPLNDVVDPDALDNLFERTAPGGYVLFEYCGYAVRVESDGSVHVEAAADAESPPPAELREE
ncbi:HalOD1 output domain-containing protein [Halomarina rubra]|uniref:HalOD1 output domain-containing protein n=1 Tax=Halomarina rubra TaxID=2071873 RepID=A0ABD6B2E8_9EURY|nr:HalOD1 output domain-containing protein [Halomarina rubra]